MYILLKYYFHYTDTSGLQLKLPLLLDVCAFVSLGLLSFFAPSMSGTPIRLRERCVFHVTTKSPLYVLAALTRCAPQIFIFMKIYTADGVFLGTSNQFIATMPPPTQSVIERE
jgi:hypothetical protein